MTNPTSDIYSDRPDIVITEKNRLQEIESLRPKSVRSFRAAVVGKIIGAITAVVGAILISVGLGFTVFSGVTPIAITATIIAIGIALSFCGISTALLSHHRESIRSKNLLIIDALLNTSSGLKKSVARLNQAEEMINKMAEKSSLFQERAATLYTRTLEDLKSCSRQLSMDIDNSLPQEGLPHEDTVAIWKKEISLFENRCTLFFSALELNFRVEDSLNFIREMCRTRQIPSEDMDVVAAPIESLRRQILALSLTSLNEKFNNVCRDLDVELTIQTTGLSTRINKLNALHKRGLDDFLKSIEKQRRELFELAYQGECNLFVRRREIFAATFKRFQDETEDLLVEKGPNLLARKKNTVLLSEDLNDNRTGTYIKKKVKSFGDTIDSSMRFLMEQKSYIAELVNDETDINTLTYFLNRLNLFISVETDENLDEVMSTLEEEIKQGWVESYSLWHRSVYPVYSILNDIILVERLVDGQEKQELMASIKQDLLWVARNFNINVDPGLIVSDSFGALISISEHVFKEFRSMQQDMGNWLAIQESLATIYTELCSLINGDFTANKKAYDDYLTDAIDSFTLELEEANRSLQKNQAELRKSDHAQIIFRGETIVLEQLLNSFYNMGPLLEEKSQIESRAAVFSPSSLEYQKEQKSIETLELSFTEEGISQADIKSLIDKGFSRSRVFFDRLNDYVWTAKKVEKDLRQRLLIQMNLIDFNDKVTLWFDDRDVRPLELIDREISEKQSIKRSLVARVRNIITVADELECHSLSKQLTSEINTLLEIGGYLNKIQMCLQESIEGDESVDYNDSRDE